MDGKTGFYNIPAAVPFADALAEGLLAETQDSPEKLARYKILLPTRRACRSLSEAFLRRTDGRPMILPVMQPVGDIDEDLLAMESGFGIGALDIALPPAISPLRRKILLARTIMALPGFTRGTGQAVALADALGRLIDQIYTEGRDLADLPRLVRDEDLAGHWQVTVKFLEILSHAWPDILAQEHVIDAADRRIRLIESLGTLWRDHPPTDPIIAAGSTGSIPATARLLGVIGQLPQGRVILPGLDADMDDESWDALGETHPQFTLKTLLDSCNIARDNVQTWPYKAPSSPQDDRPAPMREKEHQARRMLAREIMRPAETTHLWQALASGHNAPADDLYGALEHIRRFDCENDRHEAALIALLFRHTLETPGRTAALVTPDRALARRVITACRRWDIHIDDSAGVPLNKTRLGSYLRLLGMAAIRNFTPSSLLALLKHPCCRLGIADTARARAVAKLEITSLRGPKQADGLAVLQPENAAPDPSLTVLTDTLAQGFAPFLALKNAKETDFGQYLDAHIALAEHCAAGTQSGTGASQDHYSNEIDDDSHDGAAFLWRGDDGEAAALFLAELRTQIQDMPSVTPDEYLDILEEFMSAVTVRAAYGMHPRLAILGQMEARLIHADLMILGGLNEGVWPPDPGHDPWMSRPMRRDFGLPGPERSIGLAAHDFVQGFCGREVVLTRARRSGGSPTRPARWLLRLETVLTALGTSPDILTAGGDYLHWADLIDKPEGVPAPYERPAPRPPPEDRPDTLYVTDIERWMRDPYALYARRILRLKKLPDIEEKADAATKGTVMHKVLDRFVSDHPDDLPPDAYEKLCALGRKILSETMETPTLWAFWWPRFERLAEWFIAHEQQWRETAKPVLTEAEGMAELALEGGGTFTIKAKADRIDDMGEGRYAVIDYKTGMSPSDKDVANGYAPQLPLEAMILLKGGFADLAANDVGYMGFWKMSGGTVAGEDKPVGTDRPYYDMAVDAEAGLTRLVQVFSDPQTPYYSLPRPDKALAAKWQDYAHLARVQEWAALDDAENAE